MLKSAPEGTKGFDCNRPLTYDEARAFADHGFRFVFRYVPRIIQAANDLSAKEAELIHRAGLAIGLVQHVMVPGWMPTEAMGAAYGNKSVRAARDCGAPQGVEVWCDLEEVSREATPALVTQYCKAWWKAAKDNGGDGGLYVGYRAGLDSHDLYYRLPFTRYWASYNLDKPNYPAVRGVQLQQHAAKTGDIPAAIHWARNEIDTNTVVRDNLGGLPVFWAPDEWDV